MKKRRPLPEKKTLLYRIILIAAALTFLPVASWAVEFEVMRYPEPKTLELAVGEAIILKNKTGGKFFFDFSNPSIAQVESPGSRVLESPNKKIREMAQDFDWILIRGVSVGGTDMKIWQGETLVDVYHIEVGYDVTRLKQKLNALLPEEKDLQVLSTNNAITLAGRVSSLANLTTALELASAYAPENKVNNLAQVGGVHQVMLEVKIAEMQRSTGRNMGVNFTYSRGNDFLASFPGGVEVTETGELISNAVSTLFRFTSGDSFWTFYLDVLKSEGLAKILAEPNLMALSGQTATFLAGGEFPVPVPQDNGNTTIEYREYGVGLHFTPTVLSEDKIAIQVAPTVSELDFTNAVQLSGYFAPGLTTRKASTTIELGDGESFAIAGLLQDNVRDAVLKYPVLGDIPILGALFRSRQFQKNKTELVIIVTPRIVKPQERANLPLPTDFYTEPDDAEFYLLGALEGRGPHAAAAPEAAPAPGFGEEIPSGTLEGSFGHGIPSVAE